MSNWLRNTGSRSLDPPRRCEIRLRPVGNIYAREGRKAAAHSMAKHIFIHACVYLRLIWRGGRAKLDVERENPRSGNSTEIPKMCVGQGSMVTQEMLIGESVGKALIEDC